MQPPRPEKVRQPRPDRTRQIESYVREHPAETLKAVAQRFGVSRQWVQQVVQRSGIERDISKGPFFRTCVVCGDRKQVRSSHESAGRYCLAHSNNARTKSQTLTCDGCGDAFTLTGKKLTTWKRNRRYNPLLQWTWCPRCVQDGKPWALSWVLRKTAVLAATQ